MILTHPCTTGSLVSLTLPRILVAYEPQTLTREEKKKKRQTKKRKRQTEKAEQIVREVK